MGYCTADDVKKRIDERKLIELTDTLNTEKVDTEKVDRAITDATAMVDSYVAGKYAVPLSPVPDVVKEATAVMAIYILHTYRSVKSELWRTTYKDRMTWLELVAKGTVQLEGAVAEPASSQTSAAEFTADERKLSRKTLEEY